MNKPKVIMILFIFSIIFCQDEFIHISKIHYNGTPSEVIIYQRMNDDLKSNNPFKIVETIKYDIKGNYIRKKLSKAAVSIVNAIIGKWDYNEENVYVRFDKQYFKIYNNDELIENESGEYYIFGKNQEVIFKSKENGKTEWNEMTIKLIDRNQMIMNGKYIFNRRF